MLAACGMQVARADMAQTAVLEEVIVTAQRYEENLQQVPIAVTALSGEQLELHQIRELTQLQLAAPSLVIWPIPGNSFTTTISMRGQGEYDFVPTVDPAVGTYLDGVYVARMTGANLELVDMQRVEVMRGPQGTLFGRNTIGGAINLVPNPPTREHAAEVSVSAGNYSEFDATGMLNLPFTMADGALRIAARHQEHSGYGHAILLDRELSDDDTDFVRSQLRLAPAPDWTLDVSADLTEVRTGSQLTYLVAAFPPTDQIPPAAGHPDDDLNNYTHVTDGNTQANRAGGFDARIWGVAAKVTWQQPRFSLRSITAYRALDAEIRDYDFDATPYDIDWLVERIQDESQFSQEFQLHGGSEGSFDWTAGLLFFTETAGIDGHLVSFEPINDTEFLTRAVAENDSAAAYLQVTRSMTPATRLTGGLRYNVDWRRLISGNAFMVDGSESCWLDASLLDSPDACKATLPRRRFNYVPFTIGIDHLMHNGTLLYAKVSRGFRAGGYNMRGGTPVAFLAYGPEDVTSFEIGAKTELAARRLRLNAALYRSNIDDIQIGEAVPDPIVGLSFVRQNGGRARIAGGELEAVALLGPLRITGGLGVAIGKYLELAPAVVGVTDNTPLGLPETTFSLAGDLPIGPLHLHVDYAWHSEDIDAVFRARCSCSNAYGLLNARVDLDVARSRLQFGLWGRNLTATRYMAQWVDFVDYINQVPGDPRTYGLSATYRVR
jgi:iron complex outermembrane receptor protein